MTKRSYENLLSSKEGLTTTSANYLANLAKEQYSPILLRIKNLNIVQVSVGLLDSPEVKLVKKGWSDDELRQLKDDIKKVVEYKSFCSVMREAIKFKDVLVKNVDRMSFDEYVKDVLKQDLPERPIEGEALTEEEYTDGLSPQERVRILCLNAKASTLGDLVHPTGALNLARGLVPEVQNQPLRVDVKGHDTVIYHDELSITPELLEEIFNEIQDEWRTVQKEWNVSQYEMKEAINESAEAVRNEYIDKMEKYNSEIDLLKKKFRAYQESEKSKLSKLKIVVPDRLKAVYEELSVLGKEKKDSKSKK